jgi:two-component system, OmpR family, sensor histidine kinase VicK
MNQKTLTNICAFLIVTLILVACSHKQGENNALYKGLYTTILLLLSGGIILLLYRISREDSRNKQVLADLNKQISDQKEQVAVTMSQLMHINNDKDRILNVVAHDLRNPINAVLSLVNILENTGINEEQEELLEMITTASNGSLMLISEILEFSGNAMDKPGGKKEVAEVNDLLERSVNLSNLKANEKRQRLELTVFPKPLYIATYPEKMSRVFSNLIANAIKFSHEHAQIEIDVIEKITTVVIRVTDHGVGIPDKNKPLIFQIFTTAKRLGTSGEASFGLGLSICKQIVEADNGKIWFESTEGKGASFFVELPLANAAYG